MKFFRTTLLVLSAAFAATEAYSAHVVGDEVSPSGRETLPVSDTVVNYIEGRWVGGDFEYRTSEGEWAKPKKVRVARDTDPHAFVSAEGKKVTYETGDVLFYIEKRGWFKAKKDSPTIEDPMVPNPFRVVLTENERGAVRATNVWRKERGLPALTVDPILMKTARNRLQYTHSANGMSSWDEAQRNGFSGPVTDNLSMGDRTPEGSIENLASDGPTEGHYRQLMGWKNLNGWQDFKMNRMGIATAGPGGVWVHIYGRAEEKTAALGPKKKAQ